VLLCLITLLKFYVTNILFQDKHNLDATTNTNQHTILNNSSKTIPVNFTGDGSLQMLISGKFEDGKTCNYTQTKSGVMVVGYNDSTYHFSENNCSIVLDVPSSYEIDDSLEKYILSVKNYSKNSGRILIYSNGASVNPATIYLDGYDDFSQEITLSNFSNPTLVSYSVQLNNCSAFLRTTNLINKQVKDNRVELVSYPEKYTPIENRIAFSVLLKNDFSENKILSVKLAGFPTTWQLDSKSINVASRGQESITLTGSIPSDLSGVYTGQIEVYENGLLLDSKPITIDFSVKKADLLIENKNIENISNYGYKLDFSLKNNTEFRKDLIIDLGLDESWVIDGEKEITLSSNENKEITLKFVSTNKTELKDLKLVLREKGTDLILLEENIDLPTAKPTFGLTGFLGLGSTFWYVIILLVIGVVVFFVIKKNK
jgi:hypothetical protein